MRWLLFLLLCLPGAALAQTQTRVMALDRPVHLTLPFPGDPAPDHTATDPAGTQFIAEWVPEGESLRAWTRMLTLTADAGVSAARGGTRAGVAIDLLQARYVAGCATPPRRQDLPAPRPEERAVVLICDRVRGLDQAEGMVALAVARGGTVHTLQWAERAAAGGKDSLDRRPWADRLTLLLTARF